MLSGNAVRIIEPIKCKHVIIFTIKERLEIYDKTNKYIILELELSYYQAYLNFS